MSSHALTVPQPTPQEAGEMTIDFLFVDLTTCARCVGTDQSLETALGIVRGVLDATGAAVEVRKTLVETAAQARELRFVSSPTIRINGRDLAFELKESSCGSEACTDGCGDQIACRVWTYRGQEYTEAPVGLIVDAVLGELYGGAPRTVGTADAAYELPENLESFLAGKGHASVEEPSCCSPAEQESCCEPSAKADCCGPSTAGRCGCR
jgi:Domain of unknown function (DUF2703)